MKGRPNLAANSLPIEQILSMLAAVPPRIAALAAGLTEGQLHTGPSDGEWSANDVLAHIRSCADVWGNYIATILAEDRPVIRAVSPRTWIKKTDYLELDFGLSLRSFASQRAALLAVLEPLSPETWSRAATVMKAGNLVERTMLFYAQGMATHEQAHLEQIESIVLRFTPREYL
jgi:hypothetical protein